jgi:acetyltransferase-like isoleucine patch superfamily enzyme
MTFFVKYEIINSIVAPVPGALGYFLRKLFFPALLRRCGSGMNFGKGITFRHPGKIAFGDRVVIDDNCLLDAKGRNNMGISIGNDVFIGRNSILSCKNGDIYLGNRITIGFNCEISSLSAVKIEDGTMVGAFAYISGGGRDLTDPAIPLQDQEVFSKGIFIGKNCLIGAGTIILDGVEIGDDVVIGAGSLVNKTLDGSSVYAGVPVKLIRDRKSQSKL